MVEFTSYLEQIGVTNNVGLISWYRDVWYRYFYGMNYDEYIEYEKEPKTYEDVNGNEYDTSKYDFVKDWEIRRVVHKLENYKKDKVTFGDKLREKTEQNRDKVESAENKCIDDMYSKIKDILMEEASQGRDFKSISGREFEEIFGFRLLICGSSPTSFWGRLKKKCNDNGFDIEQDRPDVYTFSWGINKPKAFGDELRGISKESKKEKNDDFDKMMDKARKDIERIFDMLKIEMVKRAKEGNFSCTLDIDEINEIVKENGIHINKSPYLEMFFKGICERNNMKLETVNQYDDGKIFIFSWK